MTGAFLGNVQSVNVISAAITPVSVAANTTAEQTFSVPGLLPGDYVEITKPTLTAGIGIVNDRVSPNGSLVVTFSNNTASPIVPPAETYIILVVRPTNPGSTTMYS